MSKKKHMEYREFKIPDEILAKLEKGAEQGKPVTLGDAGVPAWLTNLSATDGWRPVWQTFMFPYIVLEREVEKS